MEKVHNKSKKNISDNTCMGRTQRNASKSFSYTGTMLQKHLFKAYAVFASTGIHTSKPFNMEWQPHILRNKLTYYIEHVTKLTTGQPKNYNFSEVHTHVSADTQPTSKSGTKCKCGTNAHAIHQVF